MQIEFDRERSFSAEQAAEILGIRPNTLAIWRITGRYDLPFHRVGRRVIYRESDLHRFLAAGRVTQPSQGGSANGR